MPKAEAIPVNTLAHNYAKELQTMVATKGGIDKLLVFARLVADLLDAKRNGHDCFITISTQVKSGEPYIKYHYDSSDLYANGVGLEVLSDQLNTLL